MDLLVLRHGDAGKSSLSPGDFKRSLTAEGKKEIEEISKGIQSLGIELDDILTSPLSRAKQTAEIVSKIVKLNGNIEEIESLKPEGNRLELYSKLSKLKQDSQILIVGHEPYLTELIGEAISQSGCRIDLKKAGLARIRVISTSPKLRGELRWLLTPKHLKRLA